MKQNIVSIGGGTGPLALLQGLKKAGGREQFEITSVISMADHGGSSGKLRDEQDVLPPGDIRKHLVVLSSLKCADKVFNFRWKNSPDIPKRFRGHVLGNLTVLSAVRQADGDWLAGLTAMENLLDCQGQVLPVSLDKTELVAETNKSRKIFNEGQIEKFIYDKSSDTDEYIEKVWLDPEPQILQQTADAISSADKIVIGPGSVFTSLSAALLTKGINSVLNKTDAKLIYICNLTNNPRETPDWTASDHVKYFENMISRKFDGIVADSDSSVKNDIAEDSQHAEVLTDSFAVTDGSGNLRHSPEKLVKAIQKF